MGAHPSRETGAVDSDPASCLALLADQTNGEVLHATATHPQGPFAVKAVAIAPRPGRHWDADTFSEPKGVLIKKLMYTQYTYIHSTRLHLSAHAQ
jgi:hypothetical protein